MGRNNQIVCSRTGRPIKKRVIYLACEGGSSGTEGKYIRQLCDHYNCSIVWVYPKPLNDPLQLVQTAIKFSKLQEARPNSHLWVIFDNDIPDRVHMAFEAAEQYNNSLKNNSTKYLNINIAFNAPSIETFGLLCCGITKISTNAKTNQQQLCHPTMPNYSHKKSPKTSPHFDFNTMESGYDFAITQAKQWEHSLNGDPEYTAHIFAGIYKLTEQIKNS